MNEEGSSMCVEAVKFGIMTDEEVKKLSVVKVTNRNALDFVGRPLPAGLRDPAFGPTDDFTICKTCGRRERYCPGHCGHIDLVSLVYHPLLFNELVRVLQNTCLACYHFKASREEVEMCISKLNFIMKGDLVNARELADSTLCKDPQDNESRLHLGAFSLGHTHHCGWNSFQRSEALSVLNNFLKRKRASKCHCEAKNPTITKPTLGLIYMSGSKDDMKANTIRGHELNELMAEADDESKSALENAEDRDARQMLSYAQKNKKDDKQFKCLKWEKPRPLLPTEVKWILENLWENETQLCSFISDIHQHQENPSQKKEAFMKYFLKSLLVPPTKFRPPSKGGDSEMEHYQTILLGKVLDSNISLANAYEEHAENNVILNWWMKLQQSVNVLFTGKTAAGLGNKDMVSGICQFLEKKDGLFRQNMMGKRVDYTCRSVISPDPYLAVNEIGIPLGLALKLTYPERVTYWNVTNLRDAIVNGPENFPGATHYADEVSNYILPPNRKSRISFSRKLLSSRGARRQSGKTFSDDYEGKVVRRHLRNGDIVLVNRQPSLHKPSIIALKVRVLPGERTLRFHYANCDSFNADFDGDEINVHFPQDEICRAEAYNIVNADNQYIVPTRGDPRRGLIQVLYFSPKEILSLEEFNELLCMSGVYSDGVPSLNAKTGKKLFVVDSETVIRAYQPAIIKPQRLWTGKQVITAILNHITRFSLPFTAKKRAKIAREYFGKDEAKEKNENLKSTGEVSHKKKKNTQPLMKMVVADLQEGFRKDCWKFEKNISGCERDIRMSGNSSHNIDEDVVFVYKNELVQGVIDKEQFSKFGLVHTVQEMYGSNAAGNLLSALGRVLTAFLRMMHGFTCGLHDLLLVKPCEHQRKKLLDDCLNCGKEVHNQFTGHENKHLDFLKMQIEIEKAIRHNGESATVNLDGMMRSKLNTLSSAVTKLFPGGLIKPFRKNSFSLMTLSGAKGGCFNFQQISLFLGQQELEGKRVPRMVSGKTLPCFAPWDSSGRAGRFISNRYLSGLCPQEFYFHCMAGREGLVDTAVKTSCSGYLQRCLVKNLECLTVNYDYTVRDADNSIIQFRYGEDRVDVHKMNYMREFEAIGMNQPLIVSKIPPNQIDDASLCEYIDEDNEAPNQLLMEAKEFLNSQVVAMNNQHTHPLDHFNFLNMVKHKYYMSLSEPGEPVGIIAAQSVGEPSTQMTLNTFHHAGRGEMNVTLGIPRLLEILKDASKTIKTPTMTCPLLKCKTKNDAVRLAAKLKRVTVADLIKSMKVTVVPFAIEKHEICSIYKLKLELYDPKLYPCHTGITLEDCQSTLVGEYITKMEAAISSHLRLLSRICCIKSESQPVGSDQMDKYGCGSGSQIEDKDNEEEEEEEEDLDDDDNEVDDCLGSKVQKKKGKITDEVDYEDDFEELVGGEENLNEVGDEDENAEESAEPVLHKTSSGSEPQDEKPKAKQRKTSKDKDRAIHSACEGLSFEVHFKLTNERHILLAQI